MSRREKKRARLARPSPAMLVAIVGVILGLLGTAIAAAPLTKKKVNYNDGKPDEDGMDWWGTVTGFRPPGSLDFNHTIMVRQLRAKVDVHIHYSFEEEGDGTHLTRWLLLDFTMPSIVQPLRRLVISRFDKENVRTIAALKAYAEAHPGS